VGSALSFLEPSTKPGSLGRLAHYEVLDVLGSGGFGTVVKAFDEKLHRFVAIKLMSPLLAATSAPRKRFLREARAAAAVRHTNVIAIYSVEDLPIPYLVKDYIAGRTLQQKLEATGPLELLDVLRIGQQTAAGLAAAHAMGLIHRDIKSGNILLEDGVEHVKITDFGLARAADDARITQSGFIAGTPMYMAPELAQGEAIDERTDLFSLGSVLYTMCTGRPPFRAAKTNAVLKRVVEDTPRAIREIIQEIPEWLCELISVVHAKNPADRIISAQDVADLLARRLAELQGPGSVPRVTYVPKSARAEVKAPASEEIPKPARWIRWRGFFKRRWSFVAPSLVTRFASLGLAEATGVTDFHGTVIRLLSPEGTLVVEVDDAGVSVKIDGADIVN
jgi:serine/threonine protein kinase